VTGARGLLLLMLVAALAACGQVPQPFRHTGEAPDKRPPATAFAVAVKPPDALSPPLARHLAGRVAAALRRHGLPAHTGDAARAAGYVLTAAWTDPADAAPALAWTLKHAGGDTVGTWTQPAAALNRAATPAAVDRLARAAGPDLARLLAPDEQAPQRRRQKPSGSGIAVTGVKGAPGDRGAVLAAALERALERAGWRQAPPDKAARRIAGRIATKRAPEGARLKVTWTVRDTDGNRLGRAQQANTVPVSALGPHWARTANAVARAAVDGLGRLLPAPGKGN